VNSPEDFLLLFTLSVIPAGVAGFLAFAESTAATSTGGVALATSFAAFFDDAQPASMLAAITAARKKGFLTIIQSV
jgi:hypothetical protein